MRIRQFVRRHQNTLMIWIVLLVLTGSSALISESFLNPRNFPNILRQSAALALVSIGQTVILLMGAIDISVGATLSLTVVVMAALMEPTPESMVATTLIAMITGATVGLINGLIVTRIRVAPFMVTLATGSILGGIALQLRGNPQATLPREYSPYFIETLFGIPIPLLIIASATLVVWVILRRTRFGRHLYAVGSNEHATRLSGLNTDRVKVWGFVLCGFMASLAGIFIAARSRAGDPFIGDNFGFDSITAVVLGGTALVGGSGSIFGTLAGVFILGILNNIMNLSNVPSDYQYIIKGILLVVAVMIYRKRR